MEEPVLSPMNEEFPFDYSKYREETTTPVMKKILAKVAEDADKLMFTGKFTMGEFNDRFDQVARDVIAIMVEGNIAEADRAFMFQYMSQIFTIIGDNIEKQVSGHKREIMSRIIGKRDPGSNKFSLDYSNFGDLLTALIKVREETGNNNEDYFFITKKEEPLPETNPEEHAN